MWAFVLRWLRFPRVSVVRRVPTGLDPTLHQSWNGTVLPTESYR